MLPFSLRRGLFCYRGGTPASRSGAPRAVEIRCGSDDPPRIMLRSDLGRLSSIQRTAKLIAALLAGRDLTRSEQTALPGDGVVAVDRKLHAHGRPVPPS